MHERHDVLAGLADSSPIRAVLISYGPRENALRSPLQAIQNPGLTASLQHHGRSWEAHQTARGPVAGVREYDRGRARSGHSARPRRIPHTGRSHPTTTPGSVGLGTISTAPQHALSASEQTMRSPTLETDILVRLPRATRKSRVCAGALLCAPRKTTRIGRVP